MVAEPGIPSWTQSSQELEEGSEACSLGALAPVPADLERQRQGRSQGVWSTCSHCFLTPKPGPMPQMLPHKQERLPGQQLPSLLSLESAQPHATLPSLCSAHLPPHPTRLSSCPQLPSGKSHAHFRASVKAGMGTLEGSLMYAEPSLSSPPSPPTALRGRYYPGKAIPRVSAQDHCHGSLAKVSCFPKPSSWPLKAKCLCFGAPSANPQWVRNSFLYKRQKAHGHIFTENPGMTVPHPSP